jgi:hypothetical protein
LKGRAGLLLGLLVLLALIASTFAVVEWNQARASRAEASSCYLGFPNTETTPEIQLSGSGALDVCNDVSNPIRNSGPLHGSSVVVGHARTPYEICHYTQYGMTWTIWDVKTKMLSTPNPDFPPEAPPGGGLCPSTASPKAAATPAPTPIPLDSGYSVQGTDYGMFIQFDSTGPGVSGQMTIAVFDASSPDGIKTSTFGFRGTRSGNSLSLDVPGATGGGKWAATLSDSGGLQLRYVDATGLPAINDFSPSSISAFDGQVSGQRQILAGDDPSSCTVGYPGHLATVTVWGSVLSDSAPSMCQVAVGEGYVAVGPSTEPIVCIVGTWGSNAFIVRDGGGQAIGTQICSWLQADKGPLPTWLGTPANFY